MLFLTGASGVIGCELAPRLPEERLVLGRHRARPDSAARQVAIDIRAPGLGLEPQAYRALCAEVGTIIHCAAITDMSGQAPELSATNIDGVRNIVSFAEDAGAALHFISTAYCSETYGPMVSVSSEYVDSKRAAEALIRNSSVRWTIIRPSIIAGHSETGTIANFQGFHLFITSVLKGRSAIIPVARDAQCDFVPVDWVAEAIADIVTEPDWGRTYWLTAGKQALTIDEMMVTGAPFAKDWGRDLGKVTLMAPHLVETEILPKLRPRSKERLRMLVDLSKVMARARPFPSDLQTVETSRLKETLRANLRYWIKCEQRSK